MHFSDHQRGGRDLKAMAEARLPVHCPLLLGHAHLGGVQGILGDVVLQGSRVAVALRPECQAPGGAHSAVLLNIIEALQHLQGGQIHGQAQSPVSNPVWLLSLPPCTAGASSGPSCCTPGSLPRVLSSRPSVLTHINKVKHMKLISVMFYLTQ